MSARWKGASGNILPTKGAHVYGILWEIDTNDLGNLDNQEGVSVNIYERLELEVEAISENKDKKTVKCMAYRLRDDTRSQAIAEHGIEKLLPSQRYKNVIIYGAKENNLPEEYIKFLENIPDNGYNGDVDVNIPLNFK